MSDTLQLLRRTGRTTRMLEAAIEWVQDGPTNRAVVVMPSEPELKSAYAFITQRAPQTVGISKWKGLVATHGWRERLQEVGRAGFKKFVDPHVIETEFGDALRAYHAYDPPLYLTPAPLQIAQPRPPKPGGFGRPRPPRILIPDEQPEHTETKTPAPVEAGPASPRSGAPDFMQRVRPWRRPSPTFSSTSY